MHVKQFYLILFISLITYTNIFSQTIAAGDIGFVGYNSSNPDQFTIIATNYIEDGTPIYFTDAGWTGAAFYGSEGHIQWNVPAGGLPTGTMITFTAGGAGQFTVFATGALVAGTTVTNGSLNSTASTAPMAFTTQGDQILCYTGSIAAPTFISCINFNGVWSWSATNSSEQTMIPTGLTVGVNCILLSDRDNGIIDCPLLPDPPVASDYFNSAYWILADGTRYTLPPVIGTCDLILPVTLIDFSAILVNDIVQLIWSTATEFQNDYFYVQKSSDGYNFEEIGKLNGAGTTTVINSYLFIDGEPLIGINYYRLKMVDQNNYYEYSNIILINSLQLTQQINIFPNPVDDNLSIEFNVSSSQDIIIEIMALNGEVISKENIFVEKGDLIEHKIVSELPGGIYFINIISAEVNQSLKFVKR